jgi:inner membrane transporter RhtA
MRAGLLDRVPVPVLFLVSGFSGYLASALAVGQFGRVDPGAVAWWRVTLAAVVLILIRRPWRLRWTRRDLATAALFGVVTGIMNVAFYLAIEHLPLGVAVSIEFLGPLLVAAITGRGWRDRVAIVIATAGVVLLAGVTLEAIPRRDAIVGLVAILTAAAAWAGYIMLGKRISGGRGIDSMAVGMAAGALVLAPFFAGSVTVVVPDVALLATMLVIAVGASVIPYGLDQVVLRRMGTATFAVFLALLPAAAALVGAVLLRQVPSLGELAGLVLVSGALLLAGRT